MQHLTDTTFDTAVRSAASPLVIEFYADWCADCRRLRPAYAEFPHEFPDLAFAEVNAEASPDVARCFDVRGIPTLLVFRDGTLVDRLYSRDAKTVPQVREFVARYGRLAV